MALPVSAASVSSIFRFGDWFSGLGEVIAPSICLECGKFAQRGWVCERCFGKCRLWDEGWCAHCGVSPGCLHAIFCPFGVSKSKRPRSPRNQWSECRALGAYEGCLREACLTAKEADGAWISHPLAQEWWERHGTWASGLGRCLLVPIPRHWSRRLVQGHDPAVSFAVALHRIWSRAAGVESIELASILTRKRATPRLAGLSPAERAVAVADLFDVKKRRIEYLEGHNRIILVDDICTTGATAIAATCALRAIGPRDIELAVIARTLESLG